MKRLSLRFSILWGLTISLLAIFSGCGSTPITPKYYQLIPKPSSELSFQNIAERRHAAIIGLGPIDIEDTLDRSGIVSFDETTVRISDRHFWSGSLSTGISRKLAQDLGLLVPDSTFWPFPWDTRVRPETQIGLTVLALGGKLGGDVRLVVSWRLLSDRGRSLVKTGEFATTKKSSSRSHADYVKAINNCIDDLALFLSRQLK